MLFFSRFVGLGGGFSKVALDFSFGTDVIIIIFSDLGKLSAWNEEWINALLRRIIFPRTSIARLTNNLVDSKVRI